MKIGKFKLYIREYCGYLPKDSYIFVFNSYNSEFVSDCRQKLSEAKKTFFFSLVLGGWAIIYSHSSCSGWSVRISSTPLQMICPFGPIRSRNEEIDRLNRYRVLTGTDGCYRRSHTLRPVVGRLNSDCHRHTKKLLLGNYTNLAYNNCIFNELFGRYRRDVMSGRKAKYEMDHIDTNSRYRNCSQCATKRLFSFHEFKIIDHKFIQHDVLLTLSGN